MPVGSTADTKRAMLNVLPPPLSRANRESYAERARAVKADITKLLAEVDDALSPNCADPLGR
jgi:hypothetical protein